MMRANPKQEVEPRLTQTLALINSRNHFHVVVKVAWLLLCNLLDKAHRHGERS